MGVSCFMAQRIARACFAQVWRGLCLVKIPSRRLRHLNFAERSLGHGSPKAYTQSFPQHPEGVFSVFIISLRGTHWRVVSETTTWKEHGSSEAVPYALHTIYRIDRELTCADTRLAEQLIFLYLSMVNAKSAGRSMHRRC